MHVMHVHVHLSTARIYYTYNSLETRVIVVDSYDSGRSTSCFSDCCYLKFVEDVDSQSTNKNFTVSNWRRDSEALADTEAPSASRQRLV